MIGRTGWECALMGWGLVCQLSLIFSTEFSTFFPNFAVPFTGDGYGDPWS